jgi:hypothetical protein
MGWVVSGTPGSVIPPGKGPARCPFDRLGCHGAGLDTEARGKIPCLQALIISAQFVFENQCEERLIIYDDNNNSEYVYLLKAANIIVLFFPEGGVGQTQTWMPAYASILRIPQMIRVWRTTVE